MSEKMREEFEAECSRLGWDLTRQSSVNSEYYNHTVVNLCWTFWKQSRATLVVELPDESAIWWHQDVCEALDDAGVSYK